MNENGNLIISRKERQSFSIGADITITICRVDGKQVKIMISAPKEIKILRSELIEREVTA